MTSALAGVATAWMDRWWDPDAALLWNMEGAMPELGAARTFHLVPGSAWYAVGLLLRDGPGDVERAVRTIEAVCATQYVDAPGAEWHGTFARFLEWPRPPVEGARVWIDYDPNWRQFVGTTFALLLSDFASALPASTAAAMRAAIDVAVAGEPPGRVPPSYSNIALMKAWLEVEAGRVAEGEASAAAVVDLFRANGAFLEYGSPTYYGIDLYALALWRSRSSSPSLRSWGADLEAALWRDVGRWYHAGLRNLCGPYSRAYGMDMTRYVGLLGLWIADALGGFEGAPVPWPLPDVLDHGHDLCLGPIVSLLGAQVPADVLPALSAFGQIRAPGPANLAESGRGRLVEQVVERSLGFVATGWLADEVMLGGARGSGARAEGRYHPATIHWRAPGGSVGWLRLVHAGPLHATAGPGSLTVTTLDHARRGPADTVVVSSHPGAFTADRWSFPGLTLLVEGAPPPSPDGRLATAGTTTFRLVHC